MAANPLTTSVPARVGWVAAAAVVLLSVSACGGASEGELPQDAVHSAATEAPAEPGEGNDDAAVTVPRVAVAAGVLQASSMGFDLSSDARAEDLTALRDDPADAMQDVVVAPSQCQDPLAQLNWSPTLLADSVEGAALSQFTAEGVNAIGTVEVAKNDDPGQLESHYAVVERLLDECSSVTLNVTKPGADGAVTPANGPLTFKRVETGYEADSALFWSRFPNDADLKQQSLVLIREVGDYVAMVSFIGPENIEDAEFAQMAESVLEVTVLELEAQQEK